MKNAGFHTNSEGITDPQFDRALRAEELRVEQGELVLKRREARRGISLIVALSVAGLVLIGNFGVIRVNAAAALAQEQQQPATLDATLTGTVADRAGKPIRSAAVTLHTQDGNNLHATTDDVGRFSFRDLPFGAGTVSAEVSGLRSVPVAVVLTAGGSPMLQIVLEPVRAHSSTSATPMEFSDQPSFSVAGVTDWTAVGGHGSDATLRTSEDLARQTVTLGARKDQTEAPSAQDRARESTEEAKLRDAVAASPGSYAAQHDLGGFYLRTERYKQAIAPLQTASDLDQANAADQFGLALACRGLGDLPQAREHVARALAQQKDDANFHRVAGELDEALGDSLRAVQHEERAAKLAPTEENYFVWGSELLLHRAIWQAEQVFANGAQAHPSSARVMTGWGAALFAGAHYDEAAQRLCEASDLDPTQTEPYLLIGKVLLASPAPLTCVQAKLARFASTQPNRADANYLYAMSLLKEGGTPNLQTAASLLKRAVAIDPNDSEAYLQLGILAFTDRRYTEAIDLYNQALRADPQQAEAHYRLGVAYDRTGKLTEARQQFEKHDQLVAEQADQVEAERRQLKQFVVLEANPPHQ